MPFREIRILTAALAAVFLVLEFRKSRDYMTAIFLVIAVFVQVEYFSMVFGTVDPKLLNVWFSVIGIMHNLSFVVYVAFRRVERGQWQNFQSQT